MSNKLFRYYQLPPRLKYPCDMFEELVKERKIKWQKREFTIPSDHKHRGCQARGQTKHLPSLLITGLTTWKKD